MPRFPVTLTLPNQPVREVTWVEADTREAAAEAVAKRYPFFPPAYVWVDGTALPALAPPRHPRGALTAGQKQWRERVQRQRLAERWRQHWIEKDERKRKQG